MNKLVLLGTVYLGGTALAKVTGGAGVGPPMGPNEPPEAQQAWEIERWKRALKWPLFFIGKVVPGVSK